MVPFTDKQILIGGAVLAGLGLAWYAARGAQGIGADIGSATVKAVDGVAAGVVVGIGGLFGLPDTDAAKGNAAVAAGDWLGASAYLPAPQFVAAVTQNASTAIVTAANDPNTNPLQPFGSWLGRTLYDLTH